MSDSQFQQILQQDRSLICIVFPGDPVSGDAPERGFASLTCFIVLVSKNICLHVNGWAPNRWLRPPFFKPPDILPERSLGTCIQPTDCRRGGRPRCWSNGCARYAARNPFPPNELLLSI